jgi:hypothetical protein
MATLFTDDFNGYADGDLNGQGSWSGAVQFDIQGVTVKEGAKAVTCTAGSGVQYSILKLGAGDVGDGSIVVYMRTSGIVTNWLNVRIQTSADANIYNVKWQAQDISYYSGAAFVSFKADAAADTWYCLQINWRSSDNFAQYQIDSEGWTAWAAGQGAGTPRGVKLQNYGNGGNSISLYDYIAETPIVSTIVKDIIQEGLIPFAR